MDSKTTAEPIATNPLATARQLWRANKDGLLEPRLSPGKPMSAKELDALIKAASRDA